MVNVNQIGIGTAIQDASKCVNLKELHATFAKGESEDVGIDQICSARTSVD